MRKILFVLLFSFCYLLSFSQIEEGNATYYADKFDGKKTASGEIYNPNIFTAAHKTLPFGTEVLVTNKKNSKIVLVTINDRGPFTEGSIIDLSKSAAENIGMLTDGKALVEIQVLKGDMVVSTQTTPPPTTTVTPVPATGGTNIENPDPVTTTTTAGPITKTVTSTTAPTAVSTSTVPSTGGFADMTTPIINSKTIKANFAVQLGSFRDLNNLNVQLAKYKANSFSHELNIYETWKGGKKLYKILVGPYPTRREAESKRKQIKDTYKLDSFVFAVK